MSFISSKDNTSRKLYIAVTDAATNSQLKPRHTEKSPESMSTCIYTRKKENSVIKKYMDLNKTRFTKTTTTQQLPKQNVKTEKAFQGLPIQIV